MVERINSGSAYGDGGQYVKFHWLYIPKWHRIEKQSSAGYRVPDLRCLLVGGKTLFIEVKREGWTKPNDQREHEQDNYLSLARHCGCIAIFATCIEDVETALINGGYYEAHP